MNPIKALRLAESMVQDIRITEGMAARALGVSLRTYQRYEKNSVIPDSVRIQLELGAFKRIRVNKSSKISQKIQDWNRNLKC